MNTNNTLETANEHLDNSGSSASVEDFIRELEHLEQDLHITAELKIEVSGSEFDDSNLPEFIVDDLKLPAQKERRSPEPQTDAAAHDRLKRKVADLEEFITKLKAERKEIVEHSQRKAQDFENFKSRTERERGERLSAQMENLAATMLPVLDNLDRAMDFATAMTDEKRAEIEPFIDGISLVHRQIDDVLATMGVRPIIAVGTEFDPHLHEAVAIQPSTEHAPNTVIEELLRGFQMGSRVIRHSMVKVTAPESYEEMPASDQDRELS